MTNDENGTPRSVVIRHSGFVIPAAQARPTLDFVPPPLITPSVVLKYVLDESALQGLYSHGEASGSERRPPHVLPPNIIEQGINPFPKFMSASTVPVASKLLEVLKTVAETDEVEKNLDLPLYDSQVLDSMKTVELIVAITQEFGVDISPAEFEREKWATPRLIIADIESRLAAV